MYDETPETVLAKLKEEFLQGTRELERAQNDQKELQARIAELEKLLGEIEKVTEAYKKQYADFEDSQKNADCFHDSLSDPSHEVRCCVEEVIDRVDADINSLEATHDAAKKASDEAKEQVDIAADAVAKQSDAFDLLKNLQRKNADTIAALKSRQEEISKATCDPATVYYLKTRFKDDLESFDAHLISPQELRNNLQDAWKDLQQAKDKLATDNNAFENTKQPFAEAEAAYEAAKNARGATIRSSIEKDCQAADIERQAATRVSSKSETSK